MANKRCARCKTLHPAEEFVFVPGKGNICAECLARDFVKCPECDAWTEKTALVAATTAAGTVHVCPTCASLHKVCAECETPFKLDPEHKHQTGRSAFVCPTCAENYVVDETSVNRWLIHKREATAFVDEDGVTKAGAAARFRGQALDLVEGYNPAGPRQQLLAVRQPYHASCNLCGGYYRATTKVHIVAIGSARRTICAKCAQEPLGDCGHKVSAAIGLVTIKASAKAKNIDADGLPLMPADGSDGEGGLPSWAFDGAHVCPECARTYKQLLERAGFAVIRSYSFSPSLKLHRLEDDAGPFMGFELEVDRGRDCEGTAKQVLLAVGQQHVFIKRDGSLDSGFEQVTHPATLRYMLSERPRYEKLLSIPRTNGFTSHDAKTCGLHVHVDRKFMGNDANRDLGIKKVLFLAEKFFPEMFLFSRRDLATANIWAHKALAGIDGALVSSADLDKLWEVVRGSDRRRVVNLQKAPTMEFRIFRGTLNPVSFWATLQLVHNMVSLAKATDVGALDAVTWRNIVDFEPWPELAEYNAQRVGDGWAGDRKVIAKVMNDKGSAAEDAVDMGDLIAKSKLTTFTGHYYRADNEALLAAWNKIDKALLGSRAYALDASRRGDSFVLREAPVKAPKLTVEKASAVGVSGAAPDQLVLCRTEFDKPYPLSWIIIEERFLAGLPAAAQDVLLPAANRKLNCIRL